MRKLIFIIAIITFVTSPFTTRDSFAISKEPDGSVFVLKNDTKEEMLANCFRLDHPSTPLPFIMLGGELPSGKEMRSSYRYPSGVYMVTWQIRKELGWEEHGKIKFTVMPGVTKVIVTPGKYKFLPEKFNTTKNEDEKIIWGMFPKIVLKHPSYFYAEPHPDTSKKILATIISYEELENLELSSGGKFLNVYINTVVNVKTRQASQSIIVNKWHICPKTKLAICFGWVMKDSNLDGIPEGIIFSVVVRKGKYTLNTFLKGIEQKESYEKIYKKIIEVFSEHTMEIRPPFKEISPSQRTYKL